MNSRTIPFVERLVRCGVTVLALSGALSLSSCAAPMRVQTTSGDFSKLSGRRTYVRETAPPPDGTILGARTPKVLARAWDAVDRELAQKGYSAALDGVGAGMTVRLASGIKMVETPTTAGAVREGAASVDVDTVSVLLVDFIDRRTGEVLFHASADREVHSDEVEKSEVDEAVGKMFARLPAP